MSEVLNFLESEEAKQLIPKIYDNLSQPGVDKVCAALEPVLNLSNGILLSTRLSNEKSSCFQNNMEEYRRKLEGVPAEKIIAVPTEIGLPILERLFYTTNEEIADLFTTLLAKASDESTASQAHPGFVQILQRISVDEDRIIKYLGTYKPKIPRLSADVRYGNGPKIPDKAKALKESINYVQILDRPGWRFPDQVYYVFNKTEIHYDVNLVFPENIEAYLDNLSSLGILRASMVGVKKNDSHNNIIKQIRESTLNIEWINTIFKGIETGEISFLYSNYSLTLYGNLFVVACNFKLS